MAPPPNVLFTGSHNVGQRSRSIKVDKESDRSEKSLLCLRVIRKNKKLLTTVNVEAGYSQKKNQFFSQTQEPPATSLTTQTTVIQKNFPWMSHIHDEDSLMEQEPWHLAAASWKWQVTNYIFSFTEPPITALCPLMLASSSKNSFNFVLL